MAPEDVMLEACSGETRDERATRTTMFPKTMKGRPGGRPFIDL